MAPRAQELATLDSGTGLSGSGETDAQPLRDSSLGERRFELVVESVENLAHDLGNSLMSLTNYTELALHPATERGRREHYASRLADLTYAAIDLVRQLRAVASTGGAEPRSVPVSELVAPAVAAMRSGMRQRRVELLASAAFPEDRVRVRPDEAIHAIIDLLDVARASCLGADRAVEVEVALSLDRIFVRASIEHRVSELDPARLHVLRAFAARAGGELVVREGEPLVLDLAFHRAD